MNLNIIAAQQALAALLMSANAPMHDAHVQAYDAHRAHAPISTDRAHVQAHKSASIIEIIDACEELETHSFGAGEVLTIEH